jgi:predicted RNA-binding Zn-ribbon protein involved in translation (DUF1610 family)
MSTDDNIDIKGKGQYRTDIEYRKPRERSACPKCHSVVVKRRRRMNDYKCSLCGWEGESIKKIMW